MIFGNTHMVLVSDLKRYSGEQKTIHLFFFLAPFSLPEKVNRLRNKYMRKNNVESMLISFLVPVLYITSLTLDNPSIITRQKHLLKTYMKLKKCVQNIQKKRVKMKKKFVPKFRKLLNKHFASSFSVWKNPWEDSSVIEENPASPRYFCMRKKLRTLFFTELFAFCHQFFSKVTHMIYIESVPGKALNPFSISTLLEELNKSSDFAKQNHLTMNFIDQIVPRDYSFSYFIKKLEDLVCAHIKIPLDTLRRCIYLNTEYIFDVENDENVFEFFYTIALSFISPTHELRISEVTKYFVKYVKQSDQKLSNEGLSNVITENYENYFNIDLAYEYMCSEDISVDFRFEQYKKNYDIYSLCCSKTNQNLSKIQCKEHPEIVEEIRNNFWGVIHLDLKKGQSYFNKHIVSAIYQKYFNTVKNARLALWFANWFK